MGTMTKAWLAMMGLIAVLGTALSIYFIEKGMVKAGIDLITDGGGVLFFMAAALGFVHMFKYMAEN